MEEPMLRSLATFAALAVVAVAPAVSHAADPTYEYKDPTAAPAVDVVKPTAFRASMTLGLVWVAGNAQSIGASGTGLFSVKHWNNEFTLFGGGAYVQSRFSRYGEGGPLTDEKVAAANWLGKARYDRYLSPRNTLFASFAASGNPPAGYEYRLEPQAGYARIFFISTHQFFRGEIGYDYTREHRVAGTEPNRDVDYHSGRLYLFYENKFTPYATFSQGLELLEAFNHLQGFRLNSLTSLSSTVYKNLALKVNFKLAYNNDPAPRPTTLVDPLTTLPFTPPANDRFFDKVDTQLDVVLAVTFL
jgi:putative salt-induced outer membrane protein YdiY